jgi:hypothetical protein
MKQKLQRDRGLVKSKWELKCWRINIWLARLKVEAWPREHLRRQEEGLEDDQEICNEKFTERKRSWMRDLRIAMRDFKEEEDREIQSAKQDQELYQKEIDQAKYEHRARLTYREQLPEKERAWRPRDQAYPTEGERSLASDIYDESAEGGARIVRLDYAKWENKRDHQRKLWELGKMKEATLSCFRQGWRNIKEDQAKAYRELGLKLDQALIPFQDTPKETKTQDETPRKIKEIHMYKSLRAEIAAVQTQLRTLERYLKGGADEESDLLNRLQAKFARTQRHQMRCYRVHDGSVPQISQLLTNRHQAMFPIQDGGAHQTNLLLISRHQAMFP